MLRNFIKIALRRLFKTGRGSSAIYSWINLGGLTIGLSAFLLIAHYVNYEVGYDRFFPEHKNIYRLTVERIESGEVTMKSAKTYAGAGSILVSEIPDIRQSVRILYEECMFTWEAKDIKINRQPTFWADGNFHTFFGLDIILEGQMEMMNEPNHTLVSRSAAERFFGTDWAGGNNPIGKTLLLNGGVPFMIQGVFEDLPDNSHMQADFVVSYSTLMALLGDFMNTVMPPDGNFVYTYLLKKEKTGIKSLESTINKVLKAHTGKLDEHIHYDFSLQPLTSIHLNSRLSDELRPNSNRLFIWALSAAAILILVVAWINFINLTVARAVNRAREIGVRKAIGAEKRQIAFQFTIETVIAGFIAVLITLLITWLGEEIFGRLSGVKNPVYSTENIQLWIVFAFAFLSGALISSIYPGMILSSTDPLKAIKGKNALPGSKKVYVSKGLIFFQFLAALLLSTCTLGIYYQVKSMRVQSLGLKMEQVLVLHSPRTMIGNPERKLYFKRFRDELEKKNEIVLVASGGCLPGENFLFHTENVHAEGRETIINWSFDLASVDEKYIPSIELELVAGRNFEDNENEKDRVILNETAVDVLGFDNPEEAVGKFIRINDRQRKQVRGVIADAHFQGLHHPIKPLILGFGHDYEFGFFPLKIRGSNYPEIISGIEKTWADIYRNDPFEYFFLDSFFDRQYKNDRAFGQLFGSFSLLTIFIACLGLFGLISFSTWKRSREIAIRKVMGAGVLSIIGLLTRDYLKLLLLAGLIAFPVAGWVIDRWLDTFEYRFPPEWWMYGLPVLLLLLTSMLAVGVQILTAALKNPVDAIAEE